MSKEAEEFIKQYQEKHKTGAWDAKCTQAYADKVNKKFIEALEEISEGKGAYDIDPLKHCGNTVRDMIELANKTLGRTTKN